MQLLLRTVELLLERIEYHETRILVLVGGWFGRRRGDVLAEEEQGQEGKDLESGWHVYPGQSDRF